MTQISLIEMCEGLADAQQILKEKPVGTQYIHIEKDHPIVYWCKSRKSDNVGDTAYLWNGSCWEPSDDGAVTNMRLNHAPYYSTVSLEIAVQVALKQAAITPRADGLEPFKVIIRVVKSIGLPKYEYFGSVDIAREPLIYAKNKEEVKKIIADKYPQFFPEAKVFTKETKDQAQFFYALIYPLYEYEKINLQSGEWQCNGCGQKHENEYLSAPRTYSSLGQEYKFCRNSENDDCLKLFKANHYNGSDELENQTYILPNSPTHIYKITEKSTGKCYVGKTRNEPFFRWWNHLTHSSSPFGKYLKSTKLSDWTFEVLETLSWDTPDTDVFKVETSYMMELNSIENGFNTVVSSKSAANKSLDLFANTEST